MSSINVLNIIPLNPTSKGSDDFRFTIVFEVLAPLQNDIEWKAIYIGSSSDITYDQVLEAILIGPLQLGVMKFDFEFAAPDYKKIPESEILGVTAILITCSYNNQEFFRVGYYTNILYDNEEMNACPPVVPELDKLQRQILSEKPRITKFNIDWDEKDKINEIPTYNNYNYMFENKENKSEVEHTFNQMNNNNAL